MCFEVKTRIIKICNIFFNQRADMLVFTDEAGTFYFYDLADGTELFRYIQVSNELEKNSQNEFHFFLHFKPETIDFENAICKIIFVSKDVVNYKRTDQDL